MMNSSARRSLLVPPLIFALMVVASGIGWGGDPRKVGVVTGETSPQVPAKETSPQSGADEASPSEITNSIGMKLVLIPAGEFLMGAPEYVGVARSWERPYHKVKITKPFYLGAYEVSQAEYMKVMGENPSRFRGAGNPVERVSWSEAMQFCKKLSAMEGKTYCLPTEAQWEYACRAGTTTRYSFPAAPASLGEYAWYLDNSHGQTHPVGEKKPNAWGLYDMHGNVWEWCADQWGSDYYGVSPREDPFGPDTSLYRVIRGGSWDHTAWYCESSFRARLVPANRSNDLGFRVAIVPSHR